MEEVWTVGRREGEERKVKRRKGDRKEKTNKKLGKRKECGI
jgi:hypothetical protein